MMSSICLGATSISRSAAASVTISFRISWLSANRLQADSGDSPSTAGRRTAAG